MCFSCLGELFTVLKHIMSEIAMLYLLCYIANNYIKGNKMSKLCNILSFCLVLFVFLFIYDDSLLVSVSSVLHLFLHLCSLVKSLCLCLDLSPNTPRAYICTLRLFPGFW